MKKIKETIKTFLSAARVKLPTPIAQKANFFTVISVAAFAIGVFFAIKQRDIRLLSWLVISVVTVFGNMYIHYQYATGKYLFTDGLVSSVTRRTGYIDVVIITSDDNQRSFAIPSKKQSIVRAMANINDSGIAVNVYYRFYYHINNPSLAVGFEKIQ